MSQGCGTCKHASDRSELEQSQFTISDTKREKYRRCTSLVDLNRSAYDVTFFIICCLFQTVLEKEFEYTCLDFPIDTQAMQAATLLSSNLISIHFKFDSQLILAYHDIFQRAAHDLS